MFVGNRYEMIGIDEIEIDKICIARDVYENKRVMIKIVEATNNVNKDFVSNLIDESMDMNNIDSPHIAKILDIGIHCTEISVLYYIVSEYYDGIELSNMIEGNYLHLEGIISIATQILKALEVMNDYGIYHGDIKPSNVFVDRFYNVKIYGFGETKANKGVNLRNNNDLRYLSPHQLNINYTDKESDFFSLGILLFECVFKRVPFDSMENDELQLKKIDKGVSWEYIKSINGNDDLIKIIKKLLSRTNKYKDIQSIIIDLSMIMYEKADTQRMQAIKCEDIIEEKYTKAGLINRKVVLNMGIITMVLLMVLSII